MNWWISFYVPDGSMGEFELHSPWWISGYGDDETTIVAAVKADDEDGAWQQVIDSFDDEANYRERFIEPLPDDRSAFSDRFPKSKWMAWTATDTCACGLPTCDGVGRYPQFQSGQES